MKPVLQCTFYGPEGVSLVIDTADPDTPAIVQLEGGIGGRATATYDCAIQTGETDCGAGRELTEEQLSWLDSDGFNELVAYAYDVAREGMKEYT